MTDATKPLPNIKSLITLGYLAKPDNRWPTYDGKWLRRGDYVTASQVNNCERWIWFDKHEAVELPQGVVHPAWGFFERGHLVESWVVEQLQRATTKWSFHYVGDDQRSFYDGPQSGTPDGLAEHTTLGHKVLLEFKSIDPRTNTRNLPKPAHVAQVQQNMGLVQRNLNTDVPSAVIHYADASDFSKQWEFVVGYSDTEFTSLRKKANRVLAAKHASDLEPAGLYSGDCRLCQFGALCSDAVKAKNEASAADSARRALGAKLFN